MHNSLAEKKFKEFLAAGGDMNDPGQREKFLEDFLKIQEEDYYTSAVWDHLQTRIRQAQRALKEDEFLQLFYYTPTGEVVTVHQLGFSDPSLLVLHATDPAGNPTTVYAHVNSIQLVLKVFKVAAGEEPKRRPIGFVKENDGESSTEAT